MIELLDLEHLGLQGAISSFLMKVPEPVLVDPGPATCLDTLRARLAERGLAISDLRAVFLTHIHLDHAGATGHLVAENDALTIYVHADAAPHIADPERLVRSTRRTFGDAHDLLWGEVRPVPARNIRPWEPGGRAPLRLLRPISTPGHIGHHVAWLHDRDGVLLCGDALGVILDRRAPAHPPTPAPGVDAEAWQATLERVRIYDPDRFAVAHFGIYDDFDDRRKELSDALAALEERARASLGTDDMRLGEEYERETRERQAVVIGQERARRYFDVFNAANDWAGMRLYLKRLA
ncbi:MAG: MBL fold metallo-hydrolase [Gammaproteobacteria bacterium]|nr:MBL fold metallo-hydrolase [Gammaproteobacteria bacterium]MYC53383.1 MBL fold metallo-hydrolase [Gammaproteobacteria bacterium]